MTFTNKCNWQPVVEVVVIYLKSLSQVFPHNKMDMVSSLHLLPPSPPHTHTYTHTHTHLQYGDVFSFTMLGKTFTYLIGSEASALFFNSRNENLNAEEVYSRLVSPVFGKGVAYDVPNKVVGGSDDVWGGGCEDQCDLHYS